MKKKNKGACIQGHRQYIPTCYSDTVKYMFLDFFTKYMFLDKSNEWGAFGSSKRKLLYTHLLRLKNTCKLLKCPSVVKCQIMEPAAVNYRGKLRQ